MDGYADNGTALELYRPKRIVQSAGTDCSALEIECENLEFGFKDILKLTKQTRKVQDRIDKELECENTGGLMKLSHSMWHEVKKVTGVKVKTLDEFYEEQHQLVKDICGGLYGLQHLCQKHYLDLTSFRRLSNERLDNMHAMRPAFERKSRDMQSEYQKAASRLRASIDTLTFAEIFGDSVTRKMVKEYRMPGLDEWKKIVDIVPLADFRTNRRTRMGGYGDLPAVAQGGAYTALSSPGDEEATYAASKRGGTEDLTIEAIKNDDVGSIRRIPIKMSRAAKRTLHKFVFDFLKDSLFRSHQ